MVTLRTGELTVGGLGIIAPGISGPRQALDQAAQADPDWFQANVALPGRGYRRLPDACKYLLAAARLAISDSGDRFLEHEPDSRAAVVATNNVSAALMEELDSTIILKGAEELPPSLTPFMIMSLFASRLSMEHEITGFNLTVNSPVTAGIEALQIAARAIAAGRASTVLVGAVEEALSPAQFAGSGSQAGAVVLCCESTGTGTGGYGTCRARSAFLDPAETGDAAVAAAFGQLVGDDPPERIDAVVEDSAGGAAAIRWLRRLPGEVDIVVVPTPVHAGCLVPLQRVAGQFAQENPTRTRRAVLAVGGQGTIALAELTVAPARSAAASAESSSKEVADVGSA